MLWLMEIKEEWMKLLIDALVYERRKGALPLLSAVSKFRIAK